MASSAQFNVMFTHTKWFDKLKEKKQPRYGIFFMRSRTRESLYKPTIQGQRIHIEY